VRVFPAHSLMQNAGNENTSWLAPEEDYMLAVFRAAQAGTNVVAGPSRRRIVGQSLTTFFKFVYAADCLGMPQVRRV
jgi:hypothetical protein